MLVKHTPWFVAQYGSLSVWSCQGMEYSHHAAKTAYQKHTQHSGGKSRKSPILQTYEHWYRIIQHRFRNIKLQENDESRSHPYDIDVQIQTRRERLLASSALEHAAEWRAQCVRVGSRWVPRTDVDVEGDMWVPLNNDGVEGHE